jgi:hypothetical protein
MIFIATITLRRDLGFSKPSWKKDMKYKNVFIISLHYIKFESFYVTKHHIAYSFIKRAYPITSRSKTHVWKLVSGTFIESEHPLLRNLKIPHKSQTIDVTPYKNSSDDITINTKHII